MRNYYALVYLNVLLLLFQLIFTWHLFWKYFHQFNTRTAHHYTLLVTFCSLVEQPPTLRSASRCSIWFTKLSLSFSSGCIISYHTYFQQNNQLLWFSFSAVLLADSSYLPDRRSSREAIYRAGRGNSESLGLGLIPQFDPIKTRVTFR